MNTSLRDRITKSAKSVLRAIRRAQAARNHRRFVGRYVAITGSCGKTTATVLAGDLLGAYGRVATGLFNNSGSAMYRTVRKLTVPVDFVAQEVSGHPLGTIELATSTFRIDAALVTSIGFDHRDAFRSPDVDQLDAIAAEKGKLVQAVATGGFACLNFDDVRVRGMASRTQQRVIGFGVAADSEVRAVNVEARWPGRLCFDLVVGSGIYPVTTRFIGSMMLPNILGALAVVHGFGFDLAPAIAKLALIEPVQNRMGVHEGRDGKTYITDTFKAPYWSTELLLKDLPRMAIPGLTFVLGDISDIGNSKSVQYRRLIRLLAAEVETLVLVSRAAEHGARLKNQGLDNLVIAPTAFDVAKYLDTRPPGVVLLKAGKITQLWRVPDQVTPIGETVA